MRKVDSEKYVPKTEEEQKQELYNALVELMRDGKNMKRDLRDIVLFNEEEFEELKKGL